MLLSILIPTLPKRLELFNDLCFHLHTQIEGLPGGWWQWVELLSDDRPKPVTVGEKRQALLEKTTGQFVAFIDDDDWVHDYYIESILQVLVNMNQVDAIGFGGHMTQSGTFDRNFRISAEYGYSEDSQNYYRYFNHLSPIRRDIALKIGFINAMYGEDFDYSMRLKESGLVKNWTYIDKDMYHYRFNIHSSETQNPNNR